MATITNKATLNYTSGTNVLSASSNIASITLQGPLELTKHTLDSSYKLGQEITYNIFVKNTSSSTLNNVVITDNLGTNPLTSTTNVTPLTFINPANLYVNNVFSSTVNGTLSADSDLVTFTIPALASGVTLLLQYKARVNDFAHFEVGTSKITNVVSATADGVNAPLTTEHSIPVASYANVTIEKSMSPNPIVDGSGITYTLSIKNYGTIAATDVVVRDQFTTVPTISSVTVDGIATTEYSITGGLFLYPSAGSTTSYTIPAATFTHHPTTGVLTVTPSESIIVIRGII